MNLSSAWVTRLECPKGVKDEVKQAQRAKRVAKGHQLEIGAQRAPIFLVIHKVEICVKCIHVQNTRQGPLTTKYQP